MDALSLFAPMDPVDLASPALITDAFTWTFADVAARARSLADRLRARGVAPHDRAAFRAAGTPEVFVAIHALASLGVTMVPLHPRLTADEVRVLLDVTRPEHVLDEADLSLDRDATAPVSREAASRPIDSLLRDSRPRDSHVSDSQLLDPPLTSIETPLSTGAPPFAIVATSGTTGTPKGAVLSRRAILASAAASAQNLGWQPDDRWLLCMPLAHVGGLSIVTRCLVARRPVVMLPRFDAALVLDAIRRHQVTLLSVVPTMLRALLEADRQPLGPAGPTLRQPLGPAGPTLRQPLGPAGPTLRPPLGPAGPTLRAILLGGAAAPPALLGECAARGVPVLTTYGLTEACSQVTCQSLPQQRGSEGRALGPEPQKIPSTRESGCGAPLPGFDVRIAGPESDDPLPPHHVGRILIRGPALFDGYLVSPAPADSGDRPPSRSADRLSAAEMAQNAGPRDRAPRAPVAALSPSGFFDTGDLGELDDQGHLHVHVRRTDLLVTGGENVYPIEIEHAIERLPGVRRAAVFGVPDDRWGQVVAAVVEPDPSNPPNLKQMVDLLSTRLAPHKRPRKWALVDELPLTSSGKLVRAGLLALYEGRLRPVG